MAVAITATEQDSYPPRVLVSVTGLTVGDSVELYRVVGGERTALRAGADDAVADSSFLRTDAELPFGVPVSYLAVVNGSDEYTTASTSYALPGGKVAVTDAINGNAAEVVILAWDEKAYNRRASVFKVGGRNVVVSGDMGMFEGSVELFTETTSSRDNLAATLTDATEGVVQLRQPGGYDGVDSYVAVLGMTERRWSQDGSDERRIFALNVAEVEGWAPLLEAQGTTLQDIYDAYPYSATTVKEWSFASTTESWTYSNEDGRQNGTLSRVASPSPAGDGALRYFDNDTPTVPLTDVNISSPYFALDNTTRKKITFSWMYDESAADVIFSFSVYWSSTNSDAGLIGTSFSTAFSELFGNATPNHWQEVEFEGTPSSGSLYFRVMLNYYGADLPSTTDIYIDSAKVETLTGQTLDDLSDDYATLLAIAQGEFA